MKKERPCRFYMCVKAQTNSWARLCCHLAIYSEDPHIIIVTQYDGHRRRSATEVETCRPEIRAINPFRLTFTRPTSEKGALLNTRKC
jgi:hypothetical protein